MDVKEIYYESLLTKMLFQKSSIKKNTVEWNVRVESGV